MNRENEMSITFDSRSENEGLARVVVAAFMAPMDPTMEELSDVKTAVSEAVTNAIVHGYANMKGVVEVVCRISGCEIEVSVSDKGRGIEDIELAMQPLYSGTPDEDRSGMGFTVMESFMDTLQVESEVGEGTTVTMTKRVGIDAYV